MNNNKISRFLCVIFVLCSILTTNINFSITASANESETFTPVQTPELDLIEREPSAETYDSLETQKNHFHENDVIEEYFDFAKESYIISQAEYKAIKSDLSRRCIVEDSIIESSFVNTTTASTNSTSAETYIGGTLQWIDDWGHYHPLRRVMVEIYDRDIVGNTYIGTTYTDNYGNYSFTFDSSDNIFESGGRDIFIRVYAGDSNAMVKDSSGYDYYCESNVYENVTPGSFVSISTNEPISMETATGQAFQISQAILTARDYAWNMMGNMPEDVVVLYPYEDECGYSDEDKIIVIADNADKDEEESETILQPYASWDVIMHEYGHHIQNQVGNSEILYNKHLADTNQTEYYDNKNLGIKLAWAEAWPTVFGLLAQNYYSVYLSNIETVCDTAYTSYNGVNYDIETTEICRGDACEESIIAVLWDLYDGTNVEDITNDTISLSHTQFWAVTTGNQIKTFSDFISYFYSLYPDYIDDIGYNLSFYEMATSKPSMPYTPYLSEDTPPTFRWHEHGGSLRFLNNNFILIFYDSLGNEILRTSTLLSNIYELTQDEWSTILNNCGDSFTAAVSAMQTDDPITGEYISQKSDIFRLADIHIHTYTDNYEQISDNEHRAFCSCGLNRVENHTNDLLTCISTTEHRLDCVCGHEGTETEAHYAHSYSSMNNMRHHIYCECGEYIGTGTHTMISHGRYSTCTLCGVRVDMFTDITIKGIGDDGYKKKE